jgi:hypothetical protein
MLPAERPKPFQLYLSSVRLVGEDTWKGLVQLIDDRLLSQGGDKLRLMVSGSALPGSDREYVSAARGFMRALGWRASMLPVTQVHGSWNGNTGIRPMSLMASL